MEDRSPERLDPLLKLNLPGSEDLDRLGSLLPEGRLLRSPEALARYAKDESTRLSALPQAAVVARSEAEVSATLAWASSGGFPVVTRGAGTGVAGGSVPLGGGVVLTLERMNRIVEIDRENMTVTAEPGVITGDLQREVEAAGLFYPPDPASSDTCSIGGNVAVGAGGPRAVKYGVTRAYVLGMRVALADGEVLSLGGKNVKDATGYHLMELFVGSEGTLGVITAVTLRLLPLPKATASLLVPFPDINHASSAVAEIIRNRIAPSTAEFMDEVAIEAAGGYLGRDLPMGRDAGAFVYLSFDGEDGGDLEARLARADRILRDAGGLEVLAALDPGQQARLWESRRVLGDAMKKLSPEIGKADVVVPIQSVPALVARVKEISAGTGLRIACFGHAGDGNVHVNILREALSDAEWGAKLPRAMEEVMTATAAFGGRPSGEHGIGALKRREMREFLGERVVELMAGVKKVFDPRGILNPGKVL